MKKSLLVIASIFLFALLFFMLDDEKSSNIDIHLKGDSFLEKLKIIKKKQGVQSWILTAKRADISKDGSEADLTDVEMQVNNKGITIIAEKGLYNMDTQKISVQGTITAKGNTYVITTGQAEIDNDAGILTTAKDVRIEGKKFTLQGKGMKINNNEQKVMIMKDVKATFSN